MSRILGELAIPRHDDELRLRPAVDADVPLLIEWRSDPEVMAQSRRARSLTGDEAREMIRARNIQIAEVAGVPIGYIGFERGSDGTELSWLVAKDHRGKGHASALVKLAADLAEKPAIAAIKPDNMASRKAAESAGLRPVGERDGLMIYRREQ